MKEVQKVQQEQSPHERDKKVAIAQQWQMKTSMCKGKDATNKSNQCATMANAEIANVCIDGKAPK